MYTQNNVTHLYISPEAFSALEAPIVSRQIGVKVDGETLCQGANPLVDGDHFKILYLNAKGEVQESPSFAERDCLSAVKTVPTSLASQISHIGFNGVDGDIIETNSGNYLVTLGLKDLGKMIGNKRLFKFGDFTAPLTAVKSDIAIGVADSLQLNQAQDAWVRVIVRVLASGAPVVANAFDDVTTVVYGSKWITVTGGSTHSTGTQVAVGDFVRIGAVGGGTGVTSSIYKVVEVSGANDVKLDRPVTEATGAYTGNIGTSDTEVIIAATALLPATLWGIEFAGNDANAPHKVGMFAANLVYFSVGVSADFQNTPVRLTQTPSFGNGTYRQIADLDWFLQGNGRERYRIAEYPVNFFPNILSNETPVAVYNFLFSDISTEVIGSRAESKIQLILVATHNDAETDIDLVFASLL